MSSAIIQGHDAYIRSQLAMMQLITSGCTCSSDHLYIHAHKIHSVILESCCISCSKLSIAAAQGHDAYISSKLAMRQPIISGCTCSSHHLYIPAHGIASLTLSHCRICKLNNKTRLWIAAAQGHDAYISSKLAMVELIMSGCTCSSDHLYIYPNDVCLEDTIRAAR